MEPKKKLIGFIVDLSHHSLNFHYIDENKIISSSYMLFRIPIDLSNNGVNNHTIQQFTSHQIQQFHWGYPAKT